MTATAVATKQRTISELIRDAKQLYAEIEQSTAKTEQLSITLGLTLKEAKERKPKRTTWPAFVKKHFDFSQERADELIRIAKGRTSVSEVRSKTAARVKTHRAKKSVLRNTESNVIAIHGEKPKPAPRAKPERDAQRERESLNERVGQFHHELMNFVGGFCGHLEEWFDDHPELDDDGKASLMQALELCAGRLQRLAQHLDGR